MDKQRAVYSHSGILRSRKRNIRDSPTYEQDGALLQMWGSKKPTSMEEVHIYVLNSEQEQAWWYKTERWFSIVEGAWRFFPEMDRVNLWYKVLDSWDGQNIKAHTYPLHFTVGTFISRNEVTQTFH